MLMASWAFDRHVRLRGCVHPPGRRGHPVRALYVDLESLKGGAAGLTRRRYTDFDQYTAQVTFK